MKLFLRLILVLGWIGSSAWADLRYRAVCDVLQPEIEIVLNADPRTQYDCVLDTDTGTYQAKLKMDIALRIGPQNYLLRSGTLFGDAQNCKQLDDYIQYGAGVPFPTSIPQTQFTAKLHKDQISIKRGSAPVCDGVLK